MGERERRGLVVDVNDLEFLVELEFHAVVQFHIVASAVTVELDDRGSGAGRARDDGQALEQSHDQRQH